MTAFAELDAAVFADGGRVPLRYGNPIVEQRLLATGAEVLLDRGVLRLRGADRLRWLDSITSQAIAELRSGESAETLILSPNGRIEHRLRIVEDGESTWLIVDREELATLLDWLVRMRFMMRVEIDEVSDAVAVVGSSDVEREGLVWQDEWPSVLGGGVRYGDRVEWWRWRETIVPAAAAPLDASRVAGTIAVEALRIAAGRPSMQDVDDHAIPHELDWLATAVHLSKGCYRGQETIAKVHNLGAPPRRLTLLHLDGSESTFPGRGDRVRAADGREAGTITAAAEHFELGPIALALLKRSVDPSSELVVEAGSARQLELGADGVKPLEDVQAAPTLVAATQEVLVPPDAGHAHRPPRLPRLGAVRRPAREPR